MIGTKSWVKEWSSDLSDAVNERENFLRKYFGNASFYMDLYKQFGNKTEAPKISKVLYDMANKQDKRMHVALFDIIPFFLKFFLINSHTHKSKKQNDDIIINYHSCLTSLYNLFRDKLTVQSLNIDAYSKGSIYHSPIVKLDASFLNMNIEVQNQNPVKLNLSIGEIIEGLLQLYVDWIHKFSKVSLNEFCVLTVRICSLSDTPRLYVPETTLKCLLNGIYYILFRETAVTSAMHALKALDMRSGYEMMTEVMLSVASIQNSLCSNPSGQPLQGPIGICHFIRERKDTINSDNIITNAKFKPEKISEDIVSMESSPEVPNIVQIPSIPKTASSTTSTTFKLLLRDRPSATKPLKNKGKDKMAQHHIESPLASSFKSDKLSHLTNKKFRINNNAHVNYEDMNNNNSSELNMTQIHISISDNNNNDDSYDSSVHSETETPKKNIPKIISTEM